MAYYQVLSQCDQMMCGLPQVLVPHSWLLVESALMQMHDGGTKMVVAVWVVKVWVGKRSITCSSVVGMSSWLGDF